MNILQELQQLDPRDPGRWPLPVRAGAAALFFVALTLLVTLGIGGLTAAAGLSMALGAFLAGLLLAETEYKH